MSLKTISIVRAGPLTSRSPKGPNTATPFVIEVETDDGAAYLQMGPQASAVLAEVAGSLAKETDQHKGGVTSGLLMAFRWVRLSPL
jgi:hypothetical protein